MDGFLVVPLTCAGQDQGALLVTSRAPVSLDRYMRKLASDLGHALSQTLYTLSCIGQMRAGEQIIHDILPEQVRDAAGTPVASTAGPCTRMEVDAFGMCFQLNQKLIHNPKDVSAAAATHVCTKQCQQVGAAHIC
jgi:hypothetical protein